MSRIIGSKAGRLVLTLLVVVAVTIAVTISVRAYPTRSESPAAASGAGRVEAVSGSDNHRVILTAQAADRLGIRTGQIQTAQTNGRQQLTIPYSAVLYDADGVAWTYTSPEPHVYVRQKLAVDTIQGDVAMLTEGPPAGTTVVTVGAPELYGTEFGVGGDE